VIISHDPEHIANKIKSMLNNSEALARWQKNGELAAAELNWEHEKRTFISVFDGLI
jgi:hypothetical protein